MPRQPPRLRKGDKLNFETLRRACKSDDLAVVSAIRKSDKGPCRPHLRHEPRRTRQLLPCPPRRHG